MQFTRFSPSALAATCLMASLATCFAAVESGFTSLFDGQTLNGWTLTGKRGEGYGAKDGILFCAKGGGGSLLSEKEYADFILRLEYRLEPGSNNGIAIRAPIRAGSMAYQGTEIQILDDKHDRYSPKNRKGGLKPSQYNGSVYGVIPAKPEGQNPIGEWNSEEIEARGRHIKITVNGVIVVDADLNQVTDPAVLKTHPGMFRERGHVGFLGHNDYVEFRNIRIKELPVEEKENTPPEGFTALFNGKDLTGWKGLLARPFDNPAKRAALSVEEHAEKQKEADEVMRSGWTVEDGALVFSGKGRSLCTTRDYGDFEMLVDWKIKEKGDSGLYLRGSPQVQIWDAFNRDERTKVGSGGLFNNKTNASIPLLRADKPVGEWNRFRIVMMGEKVHIFLNGELVVNNVTLENYWERDKPIYPMGQIELQNHGNTLWFKNVYIRELARGSEAKVK